MTPVPGLQPVNGWVLYVDDYWHGRNRLPTLWYEAKHCTSGNRILIQVDSNRFTPTQERFTYLIRKGGSAHWVKYKDGHEVSLPWTDSSIDKEMADA